MHFNACRHISAPSWTKYVECSGKSGKTNKGCLQVLEDSCHQSKHRMVKVLRISLDTVSDMLETNPRLKIVQLYRDPRGSMNSHLTTGWYESQLKTNTAINNDAQVLCSRLINDIYEGKRIKERYPDRVMLLQYEDFDGLQDKVQKLYDFLAIGRPDTDFIHKVETTEVKVGNDKNPGFHPFTYRQKLPYDVNQIMNKHCMEVYRELGLRAFTSEKDFRDESISPILGKLPFAL